MIHTCDSGAMVVNMAVQRDMCFIALDHSLATTIGVYSSEIVQQSALALAPCALLSRKIEHLTCQSIQSPTGVTSRHIVGSSLLSLPDWGLFQRRLLWESTEHSPATAWEGFIVELLGNTSIDWSGTGICQQLVDTYRDSWEGGAGVAPVTDRMTLHHCLKWRAVGRAAKLMYNLSNADERALISWRHALFSISGELSNSYLSPAGAMQSYAEAAYFALSQVEGIDRVLNTLRRVLITGLRWWDRVTFMRAKRTASPAGNLSSSTTPARTADPTAASIMMWHANATGIFGLHDGFAEAYYRNLSGPLWVPWREMLAHAGSGYAVHLMNLTESAGKVDTLPTPPSALGTHAVPRRLLQDAVYELGNNWPVDWSNYVIRRNVENESVCELWDITSDSIQTMFNVTQQYYKHWFMPRGNMSLMIRDNMMHVLPITDEDRERRATLMQSSREGVPEADWTSVSLQACMQALKDVTGVDREDIVTFFYPNTPLDEQINKDAFTLQRIMSDMTHCNTERLMLCTSTQRSLVATIVICFLGLWVLSYLLLLSSGAFTFLMIGVLPWAVMWYAYGFSPMCFPMVPTCLMTDVVLALNSTFPATVQWPPLLIHTDVCSLEGVPYNASLKGEVNCFKSCGGEQMGFRSWEDPLAWFMCSIDEAGCQRVADFIANTTSLGARYADATRYFREVIAYNNRQAITAHHVCGALTFFYIVPPLLLAVWIILMAGVFARTIVALTFKTVVFLLNVRSVRAR